MTADTHDETHPIRVRPVDKVQISTVCFDENTVYNCMLMCLESHTFSDSE